MLTQTSSTIKTVFLRKWFVFGKSVCLTSKLSLCAELSSRLNQWCSDPSPLLYHPLPFLFLSHLLTYYCTLRCESIYCVWKLKPAEIAAHADTKYKRRRHNTNYRIDRRGVWQSPRQLCCRMLYCYILCYIIRHNKGCPDITFSFLIPMPGLCSADINPLFLIYYIFYSWTWSEYTIYLFVFRSIYFIVHNNSWFIQKLQKHTGTVVLAFSVKQVKTIQYCGKNTHLYSVQQQYVKSQQTEGTFLWM